MSQIGPKQSTESQPSPGLLSRITLAHKLVSVLIAAVIATLAVVIITASQKQRNNLISEGEIAFLSVTEVLSANVAGGLKWGKAAAVEKAYKSFAEAESSSIAAIKTWDLAGEVVTDYSAENGDSSILDQALQGSLANDETANGVYQEHHPHALVIAVPALGKDRSRVGTLAIAWSLNRINAKVEATLREQIILAGLGSLFLVLLIIICTRFFVGRPLARLSGAMSGLAEGDMTVEIPNFASRDDIGKMTKTVRIFRENAIALKDISSQQVELTETFETSVSGNAASVEQAVGQIQGLSETLSGLSKTSEEVSGVVSEAIGRVTDDIDSMSSNAEQLSQALSEINTNVTSAANEARQAAEEASKTEESTQNLSDTSRKIGDVVTMISEIAEQTNLLALNATIEAARAGDAGKGFAVVANEVKALATQTAKATADISQQIGEMQQSTDVVVDTIGSLTTKIKTISELAATIADAIVMQDQATGDISSSAQRTLAESDRVRSAAAQALEAASSNGQTAADLLEAASQANSLSVSMREDVNAFLKQMRA